MPGNTHTGSQPAASRTHVIEIPNEKVGLLIGRGGSNIRELELRTGCRVQIVHTVTRAGRFEPRPIEITGTSPQFEAIRKLIADKLALPLSSIYDITSNTTGTGSAGHERPSHSSERSSSIYNMLEEKTQAMDQKPIPVEEDRKRALPANVSRNEPCSQTITIPNTKVGFVVGKNASSLRNLEMYFGTRVFIARECPSGSNFRPVTIAGPFSAVERTKDHILSQVCSYNLVRER